MCNVNATVVPFLYRLTFCTKFTVLKHSVIQKLSILGSNHVQLYSYSSTIALTNSRLFDLWTLGV